MKNNILYLYMFDKDTATTTVALNQLKDSYINEWEGSQEILDIINLWYITSSVNNTSVSCLIYFKYNDNYSQIIGYKTAILEYDTISEIYIYTYGNDNEVTSTSNGLTEIELLLLTLYYPDEIIVDSVKDQPLDKGYWFSKMKSLYSDNSVVYYKSGSLAAGGVGTTRNSRHKSKHT